MIKQVIVLRKDLNMRKGKMVAQGAHASMKVFFDRIVAGGSGPGGNHVTIKIEPNMLPWIFGPFTKICVGVNSETELMDVYENAQAAGLPCSLVVDAGHTEFNGVPTRTAVAIGPAEADKIDAITGNLGLL